MKSLKRWGKRPKPPEQSERYVSEPARAQNAIGLIDGWNHAFPPEFEVAAGEVPLYLDNRISQFIAEHGGVEGASVLELGPLEGMHTWMLEQAGAASIVAVEASKRGFTKCLISKEIMGLSRARFLLGDFNGYLEQEHPHFDIVLASGVLYHMKDPIRLLELVARAANTVFLWTHVVDEVAMPPGDPRRAALVDAPRTIQYGDAQIKLYPRSYYGSWTANNFCGGPEDSHVWIERDSLLRLLAALGYNDIRTFLEQPDHPNGSALCVYASRG